MSESAITDLRRELEKARHALVDAQSHLSAHAHMNAALHCATDVFFSPLHAKVTAAIAGIEHTLTRTEQGTVTGPDGRRADEMARVLADLDRCEHGRHEGDGCAGCPSGISPGNPHLPPGTVIGYGLHGSQIVMPHRDAKHDPVAWRVQATDREERP
ncbi:hypothetical protein DMA15_03675 [Streptomyces sp. WAC 01529]|uniref:hypothetical protein n=1 Tax=Streptomyces sp. WAC 01529 TaxID=2203205 RepID=UPI000F6D15E6|nr:hypothetical protein [Streptomyces sp. WAC 01529]AZM51793.1 hypothetical protein DMA15_03675 [Streptomyces sp. WAC 01529]